MMKHPSSHSTSLSLALLLATSAQATKPGTPLGIPFIFQASGAADKVWKADFIQGGVKLTMQPCLAHDQDVTENCGSDLCVSLQLAGDSNMILRHLDMQLYVHDKTAQGHLYDQFAKEASFCLRAGGAGIQTFALETASTPDSFIQLDKGSDYLRIQTGEDLDDDLSSFEGTFDIADMCTGGTCAKGFFCEEKTCHVQRDGYFMCNSDQECKSGKCKVDFIGDFLNGGFFVHICDLTLNERMREQEAESSTSSIEENS